MSDVRQIKKVEKTVTAVCAEHGPFQQTVIDVDGLTFEITHCPQCNEARAAAEKNEATRRAHARYIDWMQRKSGIPPEFQRKHLRNIEPSEKQQIPHSSLLSFVHRIKTEKNPRTLFMVGPPGTGKTLLACAALQSFKSGVYMPSLVDFYDEYRNAGFSEKNAVFSRYASAALLVIDELGLEPPTADQRRLTSRLITRRHSALLPTIFAGNITEDELSDSFDEQIISRVNQFRSWVPVNGPSMR